MRTIPILLVLALAGAAAEVRVLDIRDYGAMLDGITNDSAAFAAALSAAHAVRGVVYVPPGTTVISPDEVTVREDVAVVCAGVDQTKIVISGEGGTNGILLDGGVNSRTAISGCTLDGSFADPDATLGIQNTSGALVRDMKIQGGAAGIRHRGHVTSSFHETLVIEGAKKAFLSTTNDNGENTFRDIRIVGGDYGFYVTRTNNADIGSYYMTGVHMNGADTMKNGVYFYSSAANTPFLLFCTQCVLDRMKEDGVATTNAQHVAFIQSWVASIGGKAQAAFHFTDGSLYRVSDSPAVYSNGPAFILTSNSPGYPASLRIANNTVSGVDLDCVVEVTGSAASPGDVHWWGNVDFGTPVACPGSEVALARAMAKRSTSQSALRVETAPDGGPGGKLGIGDLTDGTARFIDTRAQQLRIWNSAGDTVTASFHNDGKLKVSQAVAGGLALQVQSSNPEEYLAVLPDATHHRTNVGTAIAGGWGEVRNPGSQTVEGRLAAGEVVITGAIPAGADRADWKLENRNGELAITAQGERFVTLSPAASAHDENIAVFHAHLVPATKGVPDGGVDLDLGQAGNRFRTLFAKNLSDVRVLAVDTVREGGEVTLAGAGPYPDWHFDVFGSDARIFNSSGGATTLRVFNSSGQVSMAVEGPLTAEALRVGTAGVAIDADRVHYGPSGIAGASVTLSCRNGEAVRSITISGGIVTGVVCGEPETKEGQLQ